MKNEVMIKTTLSPEEVAGLLGDISRSMLARKVCVESGARFVVLEPSNGIELEIKAEARKNKQKLSLELSWKKAPVIEEAASTFKISSQAPEPEPEPAEEATEAATEPATDVE